MIPIAAAGAVTACFTGCGRLPQRPIGIYLDCLAEKGVSMQTEGGLPLTVSGALCSGVYSLPGNVSSQFVTGLLLALPLLGGDSEIRLTSPLESAGYIDMTIETMAQFDVQVQKTGASYFIKGGQRYIPRDITCEGDWSQAAFFLAAGALGGSVTVQGLNLSSAQGDRMCAMLLSSSALKLHTEKTA